MQVAGFPHQVGGHFGLLKCAGHVLKPLNHREHNFYKALDVRFAPFTAKFCGRIRVNLSACEDDKLHLSTDAPVACHSLQPTVSEEEEEGEPSTTEENSMTFRLRKGGKVEAETAFNTWAGQCQSKVVEKLVRGHDCWFIMLEDIVSGYRKPCVIDLKMGQRQYGDDSSAQKRLTQTQKCRQSTSEEMGVRMVGMQLYDKSAKSFSFVNKYEGRRMDRGKLHVSLESFFIVAGARRTRRLVERLRELRTLLAQATSFRFFSSSLLIAFDGAADGDSAEPEESVPHDHRREPVVMRMIDFAHSTFDGFLEDKVYEGPDDGYLLGIDSLIHILEVILATEPSSATGLSSLADAGSLPDLGVRKQRSLKRPYSTPPVANFDEPLSAVS